MLEFLLQTYKNRAENSALIVNMNLDVFGRTKKKKNPLETSGHTSNPITEANL